jgi:hypothetical protein
VKYILLIDLYFSEEHVHPEEYSMKDKSEERVPVTLGAEEVPAEDKLEEGTAESSLKEAEKGPMEGDNEGMCAKYIPQATAEADKETAFSKKSDSSQHSAKLRQVSQL